MKGVLSESQKLDPQNFLVFVVSVINSYIWGGLSLDWESECVSGRDRLWEGQALVAACSSQRRKKVSFPSILRVGFMHVLPYCMHILNGTRVTVFTDYCLYFLCTQKTKPTISPALFSELTCTSTSQSSPKRCVSRCDRLLQTLIWCSLSVI